MSESNQATANGSDLRKELQALKQDFMTLRSDLGRTANAAVDGGREEYNHVTERAAEKIHRSVDAARLAVARRPLTTAALTAGVAALIGMLIVRR